MSNAAEAVGPAWASSKPGGERARCLRMRHSLTAAISPNRHWTTPCRLPHATSMVSDPTRPSRPAAFTATSPSKAQFIRSVLKSGVKAPALKPQSGLLWKTMDEHHDDQ